MSTADELLARYVLRGYREKNTPAFGAPPPHLVSCEEATAKHVEAEDGTYGCETGCEYVRLTAMVECPHGESVEFEYGDFGDIAGIIEEMEADANRKETQ